MSDILKEPAFYRTLGALAQSLGKSTSYGAKAGAYGQQASEEWAARRAQEEAEKERKKKQKGGTWGDILSTVGAVAGNAVGGPVGGAIGSAAGSAGGQALGGGEVDWTKVGTNAASNALPVALDKVFAPGQTGAPLEPSAGLQELDKSLAGPQYAANAPLMGNNGPAPAAPAKDAAAPLTQAQQSSNWKSRANDYITKTYGGTKGLATYLAGAPDRNAVSLNETLKMYPGQTEQSFLAQKQSAQRDDALVAQKQTAAANAAYRQAQLSATQGRAALDQQKFEHQKEVDKKPVWRTRVNEQGRIENYAADPYSALPLDSVPPTPGGYATGMAPHYGVTKTDAGLVPWQAGPQGFQNQAPIAGTEERQAGFNLSPGQTRYEGGVPVASLPAAPKPPIIREGTYTNEQGQVVMGQMQYDATTNSMKPVAGTVGVPPAGTQQNPADVAKQWGTSIRKAWSDLYHAGKGPNDAQHLIDATNAAAEIEVQIPDIAMQHGGIPPGVVYTTKGTPDGSVPPPPPGYVQIGFIYPDSPVVIENPKKRIYMPIPPNVDLRSDGKLDALIATAVANIAKGNK